MIDPATFHTVVGVCSALFSPDYQIEDKMHKAQACRVFYEYCSQPEEEPVENEQLKAKIKKGLK